MEVADRAAVASTRRRAWLTILAATVVMAFALINYAAAFLSDDGVADVEFRPEYAAVTLVLVPFVFMICAFGTRRTDAPRRVLIAMGVFLVVALSVGLLDPLHGAATGFSTGAAITLREPFGGAGRWRVWFVGAYAVYGLVVAAFSAPAGVLVALTLPLVFVGVADELGAWRSTG